jgi:tetratricopeptide (TPR) repeat protein
MTTTCDQVTDQLSELVDGDRAAIARHTEHLAGCDACRDARHDAERLAVVVRDAGVDHVAPDDLLARALAAIERAEALGAPRPAAPRRAALLAAVTVAPDPELPGPAPVRAEPRAGTAGAAAPRGAAGTAQAGPRERAAGTAQVGPRDRAAGTAHAAPGRRSRIWIAIGASAALAAGAAGVASWGSTATPAVTVVAAGPIGKLTRVERAAADAGDGVAIRIGDGWRALRDGEPVPAGAELRTDDRTRAALALGDGTTLVLDHGTAIGFAAADARQIRLGAGRLAADVAHVEGHAAAITTPGGRIDVVGTRLSVTATAAMTAVQVTRGAVVLTSSAGERDDVRAGEEGVIERGALAVSAAPGLVRDTAWAELAPATPAPDEVTSGLGALRAYKPGESRDRDWQLALASHDVKVRVVGPIARTEITETFRNDSAATLEGVYQFPLPPDAQIDGLALDSAGGFVDGAFVDKERGARIWRGVIDRATPRIAAHPTQEIIWVEGRWRDPALLDWKRGGRFELRVYPIPAHGARTIKLAYTQVVAPRGSWRQYSYPLPHSRDGSTVADQFTVDVELRGAEPGMVRTAGYELVPDPARAAVNALTLRRSGFVPRGDLMIDYRAIDGNAELRAWTFAGGAAAAPDDKLATKKHVGVDPKVVAAQRAIAADLRPTAVVALRPRLPRWRDGKPRDYLIVVDGSQSMVGERFTRATELTAELVAQMDRRDRFDVMVCDSECRSMAPAMAAANAQGEPGEPGGLRTPTQPAAGEARRWLAAQSPAGASDVVAAMRAAGARLGHAADREPWILYIGDGFASTGFRRVGDVEQAIASSFASTGARAGTSLGATARITAIGIGSDADAAVLQAAARGGGGSYLAWVPGQRAATAAAAALESTLGAALEGAVVELPAGLTDVAPASLPTVRAGQEVLIAARMTGDVAGDVVVRGTVSGQPFEQRYPLHLAVSAAAGNGFVPRLWAQLAIDQLERTGTAGDRAQIVALSQGYGVMSRETSLLVLESQAMFDAFGVDRGRPAATWTGEDALDEVASSGVIALDHGNAGRAAVAANKASAANPFATGAGDDDVARRPAKPPAPASADSRPAMQTDKKKTIGARDEWRGPGASWIQLRRVWVRIPQVTPYDAVHPSIARAITDAEAALAASPDSREKHRALVQALSYAGEIDRARDVAERWRERDQLDPQALGYLADLLGRAGERELALRTLAGLVDLDADRVALHERMVRAYEQVGRLAQACAHRIAIAALTPGAPSASAGALRCLRALGRDRDAELILRALPDDATRSTVEKAALVAPIATAPTGDLVVKARWGGNADLDLTLVTPEGARVSWMGGRTDVVTSDVTSTDREQLALKVLRRGNYLVEISRTATSAAVASAGFAGSRDPAGGALPVRGTLEIAALGAHRAIPFELTGARAVVGRVSVQLEEHFEELDGTPVQLYNGPDRRIIPDRPAPRAPRP